MDQASAGRGKAFQACALGAAALFFSACASVPSWVNHGSGADSKNGVFYGVGSVTNVSNLSLARVAVGDSCRASIAKTMSTYIADLGKSYMESLSASGKTPAPAEEQSITNTLKSFAQFTLHGAVITAYYPKLTQYDNSKYKTLFARCSMSLADFKNSLAQANQLSTAMQQFVRQHADKAFHDLSKEEAKHGNY